MTCIFLLLAIAIISGSQQTDTDVRAALERRYEELARANDRGDLAAVRAIRHETFHAVFPDGRIGGPRDMDEYSKQFLAGVQPPMTSKFTIRALSVSADGMVAVAEVFQEVSRFREIDGQRRKVETSVMQRETWIKTHEGWKLKVVDNVRDQTRRIDGKN